MRSGNPNWRTAGNKGKDLLELRRQADYDDEVPSLTRMMRQTIAAAEEILYSLGS